ncbi:class I SAM-dependent methyltransferase [Polaromonas sp. A23]|uniref:class I SAM-dependent methyltransferase n=1 Tax=Polaromonas sp. A23 TaxID=1944133 RepID=UPI000985D52C|nr:class I SAM-dependent methyltransferase [Polaromonas sp. A23]
MQSIWPLTDKQRPARRFIDTVAHTLRLVPGFCNICGGLTIFNVKHPNFREHANCVRCKSVNRQRQIAAALLSCVEGDGTMTRLTSSLYSLPAGLVIWNAETTRALHTRLKQHPGIHYIASDFVDARHASGERVGEVLHVDMQHTHFEDNSIDFILSSDVLEHVPFFEVALKETYRVLKPGGCHIFTAPFYHHRFTNEIRAAQTDDGSIIYNRRAWYHDDPLRPEGVLTYTVFAPELLCQLERTGFEARLLRLHSPWHGIYGQNGLVIVARKALPPNHARDWIFSDPA